MFNKLLYATISSRGKEAIRRLSHRLSSKPLAAPFLQTRIVVVRPKHEHILRNEFPLTKSAFNTDFITNSRGFSTCSTVVITLVTTISLLALGQFTSRKLDVSRIVFHEPIREVYPGEIGSERIQKVIDDMVKVMRKRNLVSLSAPQIGVPLQIIVLDEDYGHLLKKHYKAEDKRPFVVILNPKLAKSSKKGYISECCESVPEDVAEVERFFIKRGALLDVRVTGLNRYGQPFIVYASGRPARVLQKVCDHLEGTLYEGTLYVD